MYAVALYIILQWRTLCYLENVKDVDTLSMVIDEYMYSVSSSLVKKKSFYEGVFWKYRFLSMELDCSVTFKGKYMYIPLSP